MPNCLQKLQIPKEADIFCDALGILTSSPWLAGNHTYFDMWAVIAALSGRISGSMETDLSRVFDYALVKFF